MHRPFIPDATYFITCVTYQRWRSFVNASFAQIIVDQWRHYAGAYGFNLHTYCVMPDHYHAVLSVGTEKTIAQILHAVNSYTATLINQQLGHDVKTPVWQGRPWDQVIRNQDMYWQKVAYVLMNPWREGLVGHPLEPYPFSDLSVWLEQKGDEFLQELFGRYKR
jgi:putative transposase